MQGKRVARRSGLRFVASVVVALLLHGRAVAAPEVDVALVLAVDISNSMDPEEQALQREGFVAAFRSPLVHDALRKGTLGRVAVTYMEWAGSATQQVLIPWTVIESSDEALQFADRLAASPIRRAPRTSISSAIDFAVLLLDGSGVDATQRVIDISGDGANNQGRPVTNARNDALDRGIVINGLPIMLKRGGPWDIEHLDLYYRDCVIGGPGAFMVPVRERGQFVEAVKTKLIREISERAPERFIRPASTEPRTNCFAGEAATDRWMRN
ncbi:MAG TPA: DUF1194 domain-containing protein [Beijerinckiaceae bacterium]|jgi:hypothetical protein